MRGAIEFLVRILFSLQVSSRSDEEKIVGDFLTRILEEIKYVQASQNSHHGDHTIPILYVLSSVKKAYLGFPLTGTMQFVVAMG
jgi:hypothetical protein